MSEEVKLLQPIQYINEFLKQNLRSDGRKLDEFRPILLNCGSVGTANGSAMIRLGNSAVICGITSEIIEPKVETPDEGVVEISVELPALCAAKYCMTDSTSDSLVLTQLLQNVFNKSQTIDCKKLCITEGKFVWKLNIELICLNNDGNVFDLCLAAIVSALQSCSLQSVVVNENNEISYEESKQSVEVSAYPMSTTFAIINGKHLTDPTLDEECLADCLINVVVNADNDMIYLFNTTGSSKLGSNDFKKFYKMSKNRSNIVKKMILEMNLNEN